MNKGAGGIAERVRRSLKDPTTDLAHELMAVFFAPVAQSLHRLGITPNMVTVAGCACSVSGGVLIAIGQWYPAIGAILLAGLLDGMDGLLARETQQTSRFGAFLDSVLDRWSDSALFVGLVVWYSQNGVPIQQVLTIWSLAASLLVSYTRARAEGIGAECRRGLFTRLERIATLAVGLALDWMTIALWVSAVLSTYTALQRIYYTWRYVADHPQE